MSSIKRTSNLEDLASKDNFKPENTYDTVKSESKTEKRRTRKDKRYSSMRLKTGTRKEFDAYKLATKLKYDDDGLVRLMDFWKANAKMSQRKRFDMYLMSAEEEDED